MKIDEAIRILDNEKICAGNTPLLEALIVATNSMKELQWYRKQDLIRREDVVSKIESYMKDANNLGAFNTWQGLGMSKDIVRSMPKSEPPKEITNEK